MKRIAFTCCLCIIFTFSNAIAEQVAYKYIDAKNDRDWRKNAIEFLNSNAPKPASVSGGISGLYDFHIFLVPGTFSRKYDLISYNGDKTPEWRTITQGLIAGGNAKVIGFSGPDIWILTW